MTRDASFGDGAVSDGALTQTTLAAPTSAQGVLSHLRDTHDVIAAIANGEPCATLDAIEAAAAVAEIGPIRVHQMHALHDRAYLHGAYGDRLRHVSYFLSPVTRGPYREGHVELVPNHFSDVATLMAHRTRDPLVVAACTLPDRHGYFSLGVGADYVASFIGRARIFLEANARMPRTFGRNQIHISQVVGWCRSDRRLVEVPPPPLTDIDRSIADLVAERIPDGACLQIGIGAIPDAILSALGEHRDLGVHTELVSDGLIELIEAGVVNGVRKQHNRTKVVATFALGTQRLYDFLHENNAVELWSARYVNSPVLVGREPNFVSINATLAVDFLGQCASETIGARYYSSSGGQADFAAGAMHSDGGQGFIVLHSTARGGTVSRIVDRHEPGTVVTNSKNTVDQVVTEFGVAQLRGRTIAERTRALIDIAHPDFRDQLTRAAIAGGYLGRHP